jgi:hypothetical protein
VIHQWRIIFKNFSVRYCELELSMKTSFYERNSRGILTHFTRRVMSMMNPHYYLMKSKKILRLESDMLFSSLPASIKERILDTDDVVGLDQNQANWRVVIFRDEILDLEEYTEWLSSPEALHECEEEAELELVAN